MAASVVLFLRSESIVVWAAGMVAAFVLAVVVVTEIERGRCWFAVTVVFACLTGSIVWMTV